MTARPGQRRGSSAALTQRICRPLGAAAAVQPISARRRIGAPRAGSCCRGGLGGRRPGGDGGGVGGPAMLGRGMRPQSLGTAASACTPRLSLGIAVWRDSGALGWGGRRGRSRAAAQRGDRLCWTVFRGTPLKVAGFQHAGARGSEASHRDLCPNGDGGSGQRRSPHLVPRMAPGVGALAKSWHGAEAGD